MIARAQVVPAKPDRVPATRANIRRVTFAARISPGLQPDLAQPITLDIQTPSAAKGLVIEVSEVDTFSDGKGFELKEGGPDRLLATFQGDLDRGVFKPTTTTITNKQAGIPKIRFNFRGAETKVFELGLAGDDDDKEKLFWEVAFTIKQGGQEVFKAQSVCQVKRLLVRFLAMDGTRSPDADSFARNLAKLKGAWNVGYAIPKDHKLAPYLRRTPGDAVLAFNFQQNPENKVPKIVPETEEHDMIRRMAVTSSIPIAPLAGKGDARVLRANFLYMAFHAYLDGGIAFSNTNEHESDLIGVYDPEGIERPKDPLTKLDWKGVKWVVIAACGSLSPHYRWFGIPHDDYLDYTDDGRLCLCTRANFLNWVKLLRDQAKKGNQLHGILGYWTKAPGGDSAAGETVDARVARVFSEKLAAGASIPKAWLEANPSPTDGWVVLCDDRFKEETWDDLRLEKIADSPPPEGGPTYVYSDKTFSSGKTPVFTDPKTAFLEANKAANMKEGTLNGVKLALHPTYDRGLKGDQVPKTLGEHNWGDRVFLREGYSDEPLVIEYDPEKKQNVYTAHCWFHPTIHKQLKSLLPDVTDDEIAELHPKHRIKVLLTGFVDFPNASVTNHPHWFDEKYGTLQPAFQRVPVRNSSGFAVESFDPTTVEKKTTGDCDLTIVKIHDLPVAYQRAAKIVLTKIEDERPDIVISFGWGADSFIFKDAKNKKSTRVADADLETAASNMRNDFYSDPPPLGAKPLRMVLPPPALWPPTAKGKPENWTDAERAWVSAYPDNDRVSFGATPIDPTGPTYVEANLPVDQIAQALTKAGQAAAVDRKLGGGAGHYICNEVFYSGTRLQREHHGLGGFIHLPVFTTDPAAQKRLTEVVKIAVEQAVKFLRESRH